MTAASIGNLIDGFEDFFEAMIDPNFSKSLFLNEWSEREIAPLVRTFLLGRFQKVVPEVKAKLNTTKSGYGRIDFRVGDIAVEVAVRRPTDGKTPLSDRINTDEIQKLFRWPGRALMVLLDYSDDPLSDEQLLGFKEWKSFGKGAFATSPFHLAYYSRIDGHSCVRRFRVDRRI